jgi:hypothetical protein
MSAFVIKSWNAADQPDADGNYVDIRGRASGLMAWLLDLLGISPIVRLAVSAEKIAFQEGSLLGTKHVLTPIGNTCSTIYGYTRPLKEAIFWGCVAAAATFFLMGIPGILVGILYYIINKSMTVGYTDVGGLTYYIRFKRSVLEGRSLDENEAARVCAIVQRVVDGRLNRTLAPVG